VEQQLDRATRSASPISVVGVHGFSASIPQRPGADLFFGDRATGGTGAARGVVNQGQQYIP